MVSNWNWIFFIGFFYWVFNWGHFWEVGENVFVFFFFNPGQPIWSVTRSLDRVDHRIGIKNYVINPSLARRIPTQRSRFSVWKTQSSPQPRVFFFHKITPSSSQQMAPLCKYA
jgi:hypothetical protein